MDNDDIKNTNNINNMKRKFYSKLLDWKREGMKLPMMVIGSRQIGKTHIINEFCKNEFDEYIYINLLDREDIVDIFKESSSFKEKVNSLELKLGESLVNNNGTKILFIDEIQKSEAIISSLKLFAESDIKYNIITAGSLLRSEVK